MLRNPVWHAVSFKIGGMKMANRKKSEVIHLRVEPIYKLLLESMANYSSTTGTKIIERLILEESKKTYSADVNDVIAHEVGTGVEMSVLEIVKFALRPQDPALLTKLRMFYIDLEMLSPKDKTITIEIIKNKDLFEGSEKIFLDDEQIIRTGPYSNIPTVDLEKIAAHMEQLEKFADFKEKNPTLKIEYKEFIKISKTS